MDDLNKNQIILLTLLVSFVTSIATGIITTSLLQQAPVEVTRTMNQVVEKTIERVIPQNIISSVSPSGAKEIQTVVIKEDDMITSSISKNTPSIVRLTQIDENGRENFAGFGAIISKDGTVVADRAIVALNTSYRAKLFDGTNVGMTLVPTTENTSFVLLKPSDQSSLKNISFVPVSFLSGDLQLGQTVIGLGGSETDASSVGRVISLSTRVGNEESTTTRYIYSIETNLETKDMFSGSPLFSLNGSVAGMKIANQNYRNFIPASLIKKDIDLIQNSNH